MSNTIAFHDPIVPTESDAFFKTVRVQAEGDRAQVNGAQPGPRMVVTAGRTVPEWDRYFERRDYRLRHLVVTENCPADEVQGILETFGDRVEDLALMVPTNFLWLGELDYLTRLSLTYPILRRRVHLFPHVQLHNVEELQIYQGKLDT